MRKQAKRFARKRGNAFVVTLRDDLHALGVMLSDGLTRFSRVFLTEPQAEFQEAVFLDPLFTVSVQMSFFRKSVIYAAGEVADPILDATPLSSHVIKPHAAPFDPAHPFGPDGPYPWKGGALIELADPMHPDTSSTGRMIKADLDGERDGDIIEATEMSGLYVNYDIKERLAACHAFGDVVDAHKAKTFPTCARLQNQIVKQTSLFRHHEMPLLGLKFDTTRNDWVPAE